MVSLRSNPLFVHKLQLQLHVEEDCYNLINSTPWKGNQGRVERENVEDTDVKFVFYKNGNITIYIACSNKPFKLETEEDLIILYSFFGQVRDRLEDHVRDPRGRFLPSINSWILKQCDLNRDIAITDNAQLTLPPSVHSTFHSTTHFSTLC
jgi:hypothetical protein